MNFNEFIDRVNGAVGNSEYGQVRRVLDPNLDRQFRQVEQRNRQRAIQRGIEEERRRESEFCIGVFTTLTSRRGLPMEFRTINNLNETFGSEEIIFCNENTYNGVNLWWWCEPEPEDVRKIFKNITSKTKFDITWDNFRRTLINVVSEYLQDMFKKGIHVKSRDDNGEKYSNLDFHFESSDFYKLRHSVRLGYFKKSYVKCYNADNGIQDGCFVTTAVCDSFDKPDDCFELLSFRRFRDEWLVTQPEGKGLIAEYYEIAPRIVANINRLPDSSKVYKSIWQNYLEPCLDFLNNDDNLSCKKKYI